MKIFISHYVLEAPLAEAIKSIVSDVFQDNCEVFLSEDLIPGVNWLEEIEIALDKMDLLILIAGPNSITRPWINFEAGAAWIKKVDILPICHSGLTWKELLFPITAFTSLNVEEPSFGKSLIASIANRLNRPEPVLVDHSRIKRKIKAALKKLNPQTNLLNVEDLVPRVISGGRDRAKSLVADMSALLIQNENSLSTRKIRYSGFLSIFAIKDNDRFLPEDDIERSALLEERNTLLELAKKGCKVDCIICPPNQNLIELKSVDAARERLTNLIDFLQSDIPYKDNIRWVVSEVQQKNVYIIDDIWYYEGFKAHRQIGFDKSIRLKVLEVTNVMISVFDELFRELEVKTFEKWGEDLQSKNNHNMRKAVLKCLKESDSYCAGIK